MTRTLERSQRTDEVLRLGRQTGLDAVGVARADVFMSTRRILHQRKTEGLHGGMQFTYRNPERSTDPRRALPGARSLVVGALGYGAPGHATGDRSSLGQPTGGVARYAQRDYYADLRDALAEIASHLRKHGNKAIVVADDNALVDREAAVQAGLGWYGKSSNVLLPGMGSWFVLGSVITTADLDVHEGQIEDGCGACTRCIDGCPTGAIIAPGVVDARRCLAWLVQSEGPFPTEFRAALGDRMYGCDECQEVCPPNRRAIGLQPESGTTEREAYVSLIEVLEGSDEELMARFGRWYIPRRDPRYLRRNALVALGNHLAGSAKADSVEDRRAIDLLERHARASDQMLAEHATWALSRQAARI